MKGVEVIVVPYHAGVRAERVGKGPLRLIEDGLVDGIRADGFDARVTEISPVDDVEGEIGRSFELIRRIATAVSDAVRLARFPLVLAGNCNSSIGVHAGLGDDEAGVVWFDAHPDYDTPTEHKSGYFDGMGVATLAGQCWQALASTVPGFRPLDLARLVYCGIRDFEPGQSERVDASGVRAVRGSTDRTVLFAEELELLVTRAGFRKALIHLDLDCLDTSVGYANEYAAPGGLTVQDLQACLERAAKHVQPVAMTIASFNPDLQGNDRIAAAGVDAARRVCRQAMR
jgi:arginase